MLSITLESLITLLETSFTLQEASFMMFIVQASLIIVIYYYNMLLVQVISKKVHSPKDRELDYI
jgi:hypothetical protein